MDRSGAPEGVRTEKNGDRAGADVGLPKVTARPARWRRAFLRALAITGSVTSAARAAGISTVYLYRVRSRNPRFAKAWARAQEAAETRRIDRAEAEAHRRAVDGWLEPVFSKGEKVGTRRRYSDALLAKVLEAEKPEKYRKNHDAPNVGQVNVQVNVQERQRRLLDDPELADLVCDLAARMAQPRTQIEA